MPSVGTRLREARAKQGSTLEQISARTRISLKNLNAIEADDLNQLSSPFLYRSFVRQFAEELSLEYDGMASDVQAASSSMPQPRVPGEADLDAVRAEPVRQRVRSDFRWLFPAAIFILIVAACSSFTAVRLRFKPVAAKTSPITIATQPMAPPAATPAAMQLSEPVRQQLPIAKPVIKPEAPVAIRSAAVTGAELESTIHIELSAIEPTWLSITSDGKQSYSGVLGTSETKTLESRQTARIRTGNAGGVNVVFNGKALGTLGRRGETRTVLFTRSGYEVLEPSAVMELTRLSRNGE